MNVTYKKEFQVFAKSNGERLDFLENFAGCAIYTIGSFKYMSEAIEFLKANGQEHKQYLIQECFTAICEN